jgi:hypothetical protein
LCSHWKGDVRMVTPPTIGIVIAPQRSTGRHGRPDCAALDTSPQRSSIPSNLAALIQRVTVIQPGLLCLDLTPSMAPTRF